MENLDFETVFINEYASAFVKEDTKTIACVINKDYIPITKFKEIFTMLSDEIREGSFEKFIFDKSKLRTFHQPSMKWYFTEWKTDMINYGLCKHYKVLPKLDYFRKAVEAARKPLLMKFPKEILDKITITYFETVEEAVKAN